MRTQLATALVLVAPLLAVAADRPKVTDAPVCGQAPVTVRGGPTASMLLVPAGPFWRGCNGQVDRLCQPDEKPGRCITVSTFEIDRTEVTQEAWAACVAAGRCSEARARSKPECLYDPSAHRQLPMVCVDWKEADAYCRWQQKRLPTEAEWEKAARGPDGRTYPWGNEPPTCDRANTVECGNRLRDVASSGGDSPYGVKDLAGNVWEWVADTYSPRYYAKAPGLDPLGPPAGSGEARVGRGGGFEYLPGHKSSVRFVRSAFRHPISATTARQGIGFRCARTVPAGVP